jgi:DNA polymerase
MEPVLTIDFESRSACNIKTSGSYKYAMDPTTEVLCLAYRLPHWAPERTGLWHPAFPRIGMKSSRNRDLGDVLDWIRSGYPVEAHNSWFERGIWNHIQTKREGWPAIGWDQWRCSAAKAAAHTLPRKLDDVCKVLKLTQQKDAEGHKLMLKLSKPRKPRKKEREDWSKLHGNAPMPLLWWESVEWFEQLFAYCRQDVLAEAEVSATVPDLLPSETELYLLDQRVNERGFQMDVAAVNAARALITKEIPRLNSELCRITGGKVEKATQRAKMLDWFHEKGLHLDNTQKATLEETMQSPLRLPIPVQRALELMRMLGKSSTAKYETMAAWMCPDGRVRGGLLFHGAGTGRWSGAGVQPQNFVKGTIKDMDALWTALKTQDRTHILKTIRLLSAGKDGRPKVKDLMGALSQALRGAIIAPPGRQLYVADYASIEARCVMWLANDENALNMFRRHEDIYCDMASDIYGRTITKADGPERQMGKQAILGLGYQMGAPKFQATCALYGMDVSDELAARVVATYREKYWRVRDMWQEQQEAAMEAVLHRGRRVRAGRVRWFVAGDYLYCELPSGRRLAYPEPRVMDWPTSWGQDKMAMTFTGINPYSRQWQRRAAYGGLLVENITQACARDLMAHAMMQCDAQGTYELVLSVHDELISETDIGVGSVQEFLTLLTKPPVWALDCPIEAEGFCCTRYKK